MLIIVIGITFISSNNNKMKTTEYAQIIFNGSKTYMVVDSANQCRFATTSERKAKNFLARLRKMVGESNWTA